MNCIPLQQQSPCGPSPLHLLFIVWLQHLGPPLPLLCQVHALMSTRVGPRPDKCNNLTPRPHAGLLHNRWETDVRETTPDANRDHDTKCNLYNNCDSSEPLNTLKLDVIKGFFSELFVPDRHHYIFPSLHHVRSEFDLEICFFPQRLCRNQMDFNANNPCCLTMNIFNPFKPVETL